MSGFVQWPGPVQAAAGPRPVSRMRAYLRFIAAVVYYFLAQGLARHGAAGLVSEALAPLVTQAMLVFLLLLGYAAMGFWLDRQTNPMGQQGLPLRRGWTGEAGVGMAVGWGAAVACVLPMALAGGIAIVLIVSRQSWEWLAADAAYFALWALGEEIAFRGYGFQRFMQALGPVGATVGFAAFYALVESQRQGANTATFFVSLALGVALTTAYLRTRALWVSWGINFAWKASRALIFGLAVSGMNGHSPLVQGNPMGSFWLTGGGYGLDGSWLAVVVLLAMLPVVYRVTRELDYRYNAPVLEPAGIPVDLDRAARMQHEAAMGPAPEPGLVQIGTLGALEPVKGAQVAEAERDAAAERGPDA